jgi:hypothetical protein
VRAGQVAPSWLRRRAGREQCPVFIGLAALLELYLRDHGLKPAEQGQVRLQDFLPWAAQTLGPLSAPDDYPALASQRAAFDEAYLRHTALDQDTLDYLRETFQHPERCLQFVGIWPSLRFDTRQLGHFRSLLPRTLFELDGGRAIARGFLGGADHGGWRAPAASRPRCLAMRIRWAASMQPAVPCVFEDDLILAVFVTQSMGSG